MTDRKCATLDIRQMVKEVAGLSGKDHNFVRGLGDYDRRTSVPNAHFRGLWTDNQTALRADGTDIAHRFGLSY